MPKYLQLCLLLNLSRGYFAIKNSCIIKKPMSSIVLQCMPSESLSTTPTQGRDIVDVIKDFDSRFDAFIRVRDWSKVAEFWKRLIRRICDNESASDLIIPNFLKGFNENVSSATKCNNN